MSFKSIYVSYTTKVHPLKAMVFPVVMYRYKNWTIKKVKHWGIDAFELWCWRRLFRVPWTARRSNQSILKKKINPKYSSEGLVLKPKLQYFDHLMWKKTLEKGLGTHWKRPWCWEWLKARGEGVSRGWDAGWHYQLNGLESEQTLGDGEE